MTHSSNVVDRTDSNETYYEFYLDNARVSDIAIDTTTDQWIIYSISSSNATSQTLQVRKFTTRTKFENYGDTIGLNLRKQLGIADRLRFVADSAGLISTVTDSSQVPAWYNSYAQSLIGNFQDSGSDTRFLGTSLAKDGSERKDCGRWDGYNFIPGVVAFQPAFTFWNDKTSGVQNVDVYGAFHMWNKWFYRKYLGVVAGIPTPFYIKLCGTVADRKTSSAIRYGL